jgi:hypothetical protein
MAVVAIHWTSPFAIDTDWGHGFEVFRGPDAVTNCCYLFHCSSLSMQATSAWFLFVCFK